MTALSDAAASSNRLKIKNIMQASDLTQKRIETLEAEVAKLRNLVAEHKSGGNSIDDVQVVYTWIGNTQRKIDHLTFERNRMLEVGGQVDWKRRALDAEYLLQHIGPAVAANHKDKLIDALKTENQELREDLSERDTEDARREAGCLRDAWKARDRFCHYINLIAQELGWSAQSNAAPDAVLRRVQRLQSDVDAYFKNDNKYERY